MADQKTSEHTPISAFMITFNNERTIEAALESLSWVDELVVVDSHSSDSTPDIAQKYATRFIQRDWPGFKDQYQFAADSCTHQWLIFADADEIVTPELASEIRAEIECNAQRPETERVAGYFAQRRTWYIDRWIQHGAWVPDREIRVYDRTRNAWKGGLHACVHVDGPEAEFEHIYHHYTYADVADHLDTVNRYTTIAAHEMFAAGKRFSWLHFLGNPTFRFVRDYVLKRGFMDGLPGLVIAVSSFYYVFIKYAKLREIELQAGRKNLPKMNSRLP